MTSRISSSSLFSELDFATQIPAGVSIELYVFSIDKSRPIGLTAAEIAKLFRLFERRYLSSQLLRFNYSDVIIELEYFLTTEPTYGNDLVGSRSEENIQCKIIEEKFFDQ